MAKSSPAQHRDGEWRVRPVTRSDWPLIEQLFGARGACGGCWCMLWRAPYGGARFEADKGERNRERLRQLLLDGQVQGCIALDDAQPVGWISTGPRRHYPYFERSRSIDPGAPDDWVVTCFYIPAAQRGRGVAGALLAGAVTLARAHGASRIEGFPAAQTSGRLAAAFAWTGVPRLFETAGFKPHRQQRSGKLSYVRQLGEPAFNATGRAD